MPADLNRVTLIGRLTSDPELRSTPSGQSVCNLRVAFTTSAKDGDGWRDESNFVNVTVWGNQGESCSRYLAKGRRVGIDGRLQFREWQAQDGSRRSALDIVATSVQFLTPREEAAGDGPPPQQQPPQSGQQQTQQLPDDDDIPF